MLCILTSKLVNYGPWCKPDLAWSAGPILFLASDAAAFISGVHLRIDGAAGVQLEIELPSQ